MLIRGILLLAIIFCAINFITIGSLAGYDGTHIATISMFFNAVVAILSGVAILFKDGK